MNTNSTHDNAAFYATFDNETLPQNFRAAVFESTMKELPALVEQLKGAAEVNYLITEDPRSPAMIVRFERNPHQILAYRSRIINPVQRQREVTLVSRCPENKELWYSRHVEVINLMTRQYWLNDSLALGCYLRFMGGSISNRQLTLTRQLIPAAPVPGVVEGSHYVAEGDASVRFIQVRSGKVTTWSQVYAKSGIHPLRTVNPVQGR